MQTDLRGRDFISDLDFSREEVETILDVAWDLKRKRALGEPHALRRQDDEKRCHHGDKRDQQQQHLGYAFRFAEKQLTRGGRLHPNRLNDLAIFDQLFNLSRSLGHGSG